MPYGIMDESTRRILADAGFDTDAIMAPQSAETAIDVGIIFDGALDESFLLDVESDWRKIGQTLANVIGRDFPTNEVLISTGHVYIGEDFIEGSGYDCETFTRELATERELDDFVTGYVECALWSESIGDDFADEWATKHPNEDRPAPDVSLESFGFTPDDLSEESRREIREECADFANANLDDLRAYCERRTIEHAGHDFWLTRNGHGAGFWDRGLGELGDRLSEAAKPYGSAHVYVGDDGKLYVA